MSSPGFDWGAVISAIESAIGSVIQAISNALSQNATTIGQVLVGMAIVGLVFGLVTRYFPALGGLFGRLRL